MKPDLTEPCPACGKTIPHGGGSRRRGPRMHFWCASSYTPPAERETRLASGATV